MRTAGYLVILTAVGCSARSIRSRRSSMTSPENWEYSSTSSLGSFGSLSYSPSTEGSCATAYSSSRNRDLSTAVSKNEGLSNFKRFAAGAAVGSVYGRAWPTHYFSPMGYRYSGSCNFGESVCKASVRESDIKSLSGTSIVPTSIYGLVDIYWTCSETEHCCDQSCCPAYSSPTTRWIIILIVVVISTCVILIALASCCGMYFWFKYGRMSAQQAVFCKCSNRNVTIRQPQVVRPHPMRASNTFVEPPLTFHRQASHEPYSWLQRIPKSDRSQPIAFDPPPPYESLGIWTTSTSSLATPPPDYAELYRHYQIGDQTT